MNAKSPREPRGFRARFRKFFHLEDVPPLVRRVIVGVIGGTILFLGVAMIVLPGPAIIVIPVGLAVLATEFVWARRWLRHARKFVKKAKTSVTDLSGKK